MREFNSHPQLKIWSTLLLAVLATACSGSRDPILGVGGLSAHRPVVTAVTPLAGATGVSIITPNITATFSEPMNPLVAANFTVTCVAPCANPVGVVTLDATHTVGTFTPSAPLAPMQLYTATVSGATSIATGFALANPFVWTFTTGAVPPKVIATAPANLATNVATNLQVVSAQFDQTMTPLVAANFTVTCAMPCISPAGTLSMDASNTTASFTFTAGAGVPLFTSTTYTGTITGASSAAPSSTAMAGPYTWTFMTGLLADTTRPTVTSTAPATTNNGNTPTPNVPANNPINAVFSKDMARPTINTTSFTLCASIVVPCPAASVVLGTVTYQLGIRTAVFTPAAPLIVGTTYAATITTAATDLSGNTLSGNQPPNPALASKYLWTFTTIAPLVPPPATPLATAAPYGMLAGTAGMTNSGLLSQIVGDLATTATTTGSLTGFHDKNADVYTETPLNKGTVTGTIRSCTVSTTGPTTAVNMANCAAAGQARLDATTAFNTLMGLPPGFAVTADLGGRTLAPGTYTSLTTIDLTGSDLTLDAGAAGANAVWVFQVGSALTVGGPGVAAARSIILKNGALPKNVFWEVGSAATINAGGGGHMVGTLIASAGVAVSTAGNVAIVQWDGRAMSLNASVTIVNTIITVPGP